MDEVEEIKSRIDIVELIGKYVVLKQAGRNFKGLCPFHQEKSGSFMVNPELGIYKCFGCGKAGDIFNFVQEVEGLEFVEALEMLAEKAGITLQKRKPTEKEGRMKKLYDLHEMAAEYYHYLLMQHPVGEVARKYLDSRQIGLKLINTFQIGFSMNDWEGLKRYLVDKKKVDPDLLVEGGLLGKNNTGRYYDRFRGRVMFPLRDHRGKVVGMAGRVIPGYSDEKDSPKYINSPETPIYHKSNVLYGLYEAKKDIKDHDRVVLVEGELDMISSFSSGIGETAAIKGTALTAEQIKLLSRYTHNLVIALDADVAGDIAAKRGIGMAEEAGMNIKVIMISEGKDPDEVARKSPQLWKKMVDEAVDIYEFYIETAREKYNLSTIDGKKFFTNEVLPIVGKITNQVVRNYYMKKCATLLDSDVDSVEKELNRIVRGERVERVSEVRVEKVDSEQNRYREYLRLLWSLPKEDSFVVAKKFEQLTYGGNFGEILRLWLGSRGNYDVAEFVKNLPEELKPQAQLIYMEPVEGEKNLEESTEDIWKFLVKKKIEQLRKELKEAEKAKDDKKSGEILGLVVEWSKMLS
jgi:DNA primase